MLIRELRASDSSILLALRNRAEDLELYKSQHQVSKIEHDHWMNYRLKNSHLITLVSEVDNSLIGICYLTPFARDCFEISIRFIPEYRGRGFGTLLLKETIDKAQDASIKSLIGMVKSNNLGSIALFMKNGFELEYTETKDYLKFVYFLKKDFA